MQGDKIMASKFIKSLGEMDKFAGEILNSPRLEGITAKSGGGATILALSGELGSGKTAFVKSLAKALGIHDTITSPTFVIIKTYNLQPTTYKQLIHIDAYRIEDPREIEILGWNDLIKNSQNLIAVEWPEQLGALLPSSALNLLFKFVDENTREIKF